MRTTLRLDPDVAQLLEVEVRVRGASFDTVVNEALRRALAPSRAGQPRAPFRALPARSSTPADAPATRLAVGDGDAD
jgi:hypothetical protein